MCVEREHGDLWSVVWVKDPWTDLDHFRKNVIAHRTRSARCVCLIRLHLVTVRMHADRKMYVYVYDQAPGQSVLYMPERRSC